MKKRLRILSALLIGLLTLAALFSFAWADTPDPEAVVLSLDEETATFDLQDFKALSLSASVEPADASQRVTWKSSNTSIARVSGGTVTFRKRGTVTITATAYKTGISDSVTLTLIDSSYPDQILLNCGAEMTLNRFDTFRLSPTVLPASASQGVKFKSSSSSRVSVDSTSGLITAKKSGTATITCYSTKDDSILAKVKVTVVTPDAPDSIVLSPDVSVLAVGETLDLDAEIFPADSCQYVSWKSSSSRRASITSDGVLTAKKTGSVTVTCSSKQNSRVRATRTILIVPKDAPHTITLNATELLMHPTETFQLLPTVLPADKVQDVSYKSSSTRYATVSSDGVIKAIKPGTVTITCYSKEYSSILAKVKVKIEYLPAPDSIDLSASPDTVLKGESIQLTAAPVPADHSAEFSYESSNSKIATVSSGGKVTGVKRGTVTITVTSKRNDDIVSKLTVSVLDPMCPESIVADVESLRLETGATYQPTLTILPSTAAQGVEWHSSRSSRVSVNEDTGKITARKTGTATIYATSTYDDSVVCAIPVTVYSLPAPEKLAVTAETTYLKLGESTQLIVTPTPSDSSSLCEYRISSNAVEVDQNGLLTAKNLGRATVTLVSKKDSDVRAKIDFVVYDPLTPVSVTLDQELVYLNVGKTAQLSGSVFPDTASQTLYWSSSDPSVVVVSDEGVLTGIGSGTAVVRASTDNSVYATCTVAVSSNKVATTIPARTTDIAGISVNLQKIDAIRQSAISQIINLNKAGVISYAESVERQEVINAAFEMQAFPWITMNYQRYWTEDYLEKSYLPGRVYYGLPYIQKGLNNGPNRRYNVAKALKEKRYLDSGNGYYVLNQDNLLDGLYVGNDCSAFVSIAYWGPDITRGHFRTGQMATSTLYKTLNSYDDMRTGDFLVLADNHVIMFLYWVDEAHTKMMIIEQGGDGNTVICSIKSITGYQTDGYIPRRLATFSQN